MICSKCKNYTSRYTVTSPGSAICEDCIKHSITEQGTVKVITVVHIKCKKCQDSYDLTSGNLQVADDGSILCTGCFYRLELT